MPKILISYDLSTPPGRHTQVKNDMLDKGYTAVWNHNGVVYDMPNTTLAHLNTTRSQAIADLKSAVAAVGARLEMVVAVEFDGFSAEQVNPRG